LETSKEGKYYSQITFIVLENSFKALHQTDTSISINFSALDIEKRDTRERFITLVEENRADAHRVTLELIEDKNISDFNLIRDFIQEIKSLGVQVAIDDFGVGYSNFERVLEYKPDFLKIDGRLIRNLSTDRFAYSIVQSIVSFAKKENLQTIAEFVESEDIYNIICEMGVDYSQGYYFGKPDKLLA
jgi:EAL domain-containing protein (putative c-di-GMP-specific phosphodiesterase class I)